MGAFRSGVAHRPTILFWGQCRRATGDADQNTTAGEGQLESVQPERVDDPDFPVTGSEGIGRLLECFQIVTQKS